MTIPLAETVRQAAQKLKEFTVRDLAHDAGARTYAEQFAVRNTIRDFLRRGEMERVSRGKYRFTPVKKSPTFRQRFWDIARRMIEFTRKDLAQITGANKETINSFCIWIVRAGYARRVGWGRYRVTGRLKPEVPSGKVSR